MKYLIFLLAVVVLLWLLRGALRGRNLPPGAQPPKGALPQQMLACAQCGIHLPLNEALPGRGGVFCGDAHREAYERAHPE